MLTSLGGGLLGLFGRRFLITAWLPSLLYWAGFGALAATGTGWRQATGWWLRQPAEFKVLLAGLALAWITFFAYLLATWVPVAIRLGEGYWPRHRPWSWLYRRRREAHVARLKSMRSDPAALPRLYLDYPLRESQVMPTRLGNILRSAEDHALERYQINAVVAWPRLYVVLPDQFIAAVAAAKTPLDLMAALAALASFFAVSGTAVAATLLPWYAALACLAGGLLISWLGYQGAVQAARPYGQLVRAAFDVHRGLLLDAIGWTRPPSYAAERRQWEQISHLWYQGAPEGTAGAALLGYPGRMNGAPDVQLPGDAERTPWEACARYASWGHRVIFADIFAWVEYDQAEPAATPARRTCAVFCCGSTCITSTHPPTSHASSASRWTRPHSSGSSNRIKPATRKAPPEIVAERIPASVYPSDPLKLEQILAG